MENREDTTGWLLSMSEGWEPRQNEQQTQKDESQLHQENSCLCPAFAG